MKVSTFVSKAYLLIAACVLRNDVFASASELEFAVPEPAVRSVANVPPPNRERDLQECLITRGQILRAMEYASDDIVNPTLLVICRGTYRFDEQIDLTNKSVIFRCAEPGNCAFIPWRRRTGGRNFYGNPVFARFEGIVFTRWQGNKFRFTRLSRRCDFIRRFPLIASRCPETNLAYDKAGGVMYFTGGIVEISVVAFLDNRSFVVGPVAMTRGGSLTLDTVLFDNNSYDRRYEDSRFKGSIDPVEFGRGGAVYVKDSNLNAFGCTIRDNFASIGGGIYAFNSNVRVDDVEFIENIATENGGSLSFEQTQAEVTANFFQDGSASLGNDIYVIDDTDRSESYVECPRTNYHCNGFDSSFLAESGEAFVNLNCTSTASGFIDACNFLSPDMKWNWAYQTRDAIEEDPDDVECDDC